MTAQSREKLLYEGVEYGMATEPLGQYLITRDDIKFVFTCTNCWRGYYGKWEIINDELFLVNLKAHINDYQEVGLEYLFPEKEKVFAKWFTGIIKIPLGEMLEYIHMGYESIYEKNLMLCFNKGILVLKREVDKHDKNIG